jgi:hypothetical protein
MNYLFMCSIRKPVVPKQQTWAVFVTVLTQNTCLQQRRGGAAGPKLRLDWPLRLPTPAKRLRLLSQKFCCRLRFWSMASRIGWRLV